MAEDKKTKDEAATPAVKEQNPTQVQHIIPNEAMRVEGAMDSFLNPALFSQLQRGAALLASSKLVPDRFRNDVPSCFIALELAARMKMDPIMLMQRAYVVHGKPGFEAQFVISLVNSSGRFRDPLDWEMSGEGRDRKAICFTHRHDGRRVQAEVTMAMADAEGWTSKKDSKWKTLPDLMLMYRSAAFFGRLHCPEVLMGMSTVEELEDVGPSKDKDFKPTTRVINPDEDVSVQKTEAVASKLRAKRDKSTQDSPQEAARGVETPPAEPEAVEPEKNAAGGKIDYESMSVQEMRGVAMDLWKKAGYDEDSATQTLGCSQNQWTKAKCIGLIQMAQKALDDQEAAGI